MTDNGTVAASVPIAVPTMSRVNGIKNTTNSKNGNERTIFTNKFRTLYTTRFSSSLSLPHKNKYVPMGNPISMAAKIDTPTMKKVSLMARQISASYCFNTSNTQSPTFHKLINEGLRVLIRIFDACSL